MNGSLPTMTDTFKTSAAKRGQIQQLGYRPRAPYRLDLQVFSMADLRRRGSQAKVRTTHRYEFHTLVCVTQGECQQMIDFKSIACGPGSLLVLRPGQAHNYGMETDWDGWNVLFRPEFVLPVDLDRLPEHIVLRGNELRTVMDAIRQIQEDAAMEAPLDDVHALLRHQLHALLARLAILQGRQHAHEAPPSAAMLRFKRFQQLVDERFSQWHQVASYADQLGYTEKSLARAVAATMGTTAKVFIAARINLEAKRLLVHTDLAVAAIADKLGFEEPTNFSKFFKREAGCTPAEFRKRQAD